MGGGGSITTMISSLKNNKNLRRERTSAQARMTGPSGSKKLDYRQMTTKEMETFKINLKRNYRDAVVARTFIYLLIAGIVFSIFYFLIFS